jgi:hypothetical protein
MSPILGARGGLAASAYGFTSAVAAAVGDYESIATITVGSGGSTSVEFTSIPSTYTHLQLRMNIRSNRAISVEAYTLQFNSTGSNQYSGHLLAGNGATSQTYAETGQNSGLGAYIAGDSAGSNIFGGAISDILDYANTNKYKTVRSLGVTDQNGSGNISLTSCLWQNTAAINSIKFLSGGTGWTQYSSFALYGVK